MNSVAPLAAHVTDFPLDKIRQSAFFPLAFERLVAT